MYYDILLFINNFLLHYQLVANQIHSNSNFIQSFSLYFSFSLVLPIAHQLVVLHTNCNQFLLHFPQIGIPWHVSPPPRRFVLNDCFGQLQFPHWICMPCIYLADCYFPVWTRDPKRSWQGRLTPCEGSRRCREPPPAARHSSACRIPRDCGGWLPPARAAPEHDPWEPHQSCQLEPSQIQKSGRCLRETGQSLLQ